MFFKFKGSIFRFFFLFFLSFFKQRYKIEDPKISLYMKWKQLSRSQTAILNKVYTFHGSMERKIYLLKKPAAGAARINFIQIPPPLEMSKIFRRGGICKEFPWYEENKESHEFTVDNTIAF